MRRHVASFSETLHAEGVTFRHVARQLNLPLRTLSHWRHQLHAPQPSPWQVRGRPCCESTLELRQEVLELWETTGPRLGIPMLRQLFPEMPRCELVDLERDYRMAFRRTHQVSREVLTWKQPRRVWAMDHVHAPSPIDGCYSEILSIRDLASGLQLAWLPVPDEMADTTCAVLQWLFHAYGPPLVLKSDNKAGFRSDTTHDLLAHFGVKELFSPPVTPRYNGGCEAGNGALQVRTHEQAALRGRAGYWICDDLEAARRHTNECVVSASQRTPQQLWDQANPITAEERHVFLQTVRDTERTLRETLAAHLALPSTPRAEDALQRRVIRRALVELGLLSINRRLIPLPLKRRKLAMFS